jgi:hypothetical protein
LDIRGQVKKERGVRKTSKWGPILPERRSTMIVNDGRSSLEKANDNKKKEDNYTQGKKKKVCKPVQSKYLLDVAGAVGVDLGGCELELQDNLIVCSKFERGRKRENIVNLVGLDCDGENVIEKGRTVDKEA